MCEEDIGPLAAIQTDGSLVSAAHVPADGDLRRARRSDGAWGPWSLPVPRTADKATIDGFQTPPLRCGADQSGNQLQWSELTRITNPRLIHAGNRAAAGPEDVSFEQATPNTILLKFLQTAASWNLSMRLTLRTHPIFHLADFYDRVRNLDAVNDLALVLSRALGCILRRTLDRALACDLDLSGDLDQALDRELDLPREIARHLDRHLDLARNLARDLAYDLTCHLAHIRDLAFLPPLDIDDALDQILNLPQTSNYARLSARSLARDLDRVHTLIDDFHRVGSFAQELAQTIQALKHLHRVLSDVTELDLQSTDFAEIPLEGLRWSANTRWPPEIEHQIQRNSTRITDEIFEIGPASTT
jgi:hypothetical protein